MTRLSTTNRRKVINSQKLFKFLTHPCIVLWLDAYKRIELVFGERRTPALY